MDLHPDPLQTQLRRALRTGLAGVAARPGVRDAPVHDGPASPAALVLTELSVPTYELPVARGGLGLGLVAGVTVSEELGRAACGNPYRAAALVADAALAAGRPDVLDDLQAGATVAAGGLEALPSGEDAITAVRVDGGAELTGTVGTDAAGADLIAVACRLRGAEALALITAGSSGYKWHSASWPYAVQLSSVPVASRDLMRRFGGPGAGPLARARIRQAAYLLGLSAGMHDAAVRYTGARWQFGTRLRDNQAIAFPLARTAIALRATRMLVNRAVWLVEQGSVSTAPVEALASAAETMIETAHVTMQACGARAMTSELSLHRYYRLAAAEPFCYGKPGDLWRLAGAARLADAAAALTRPS
jgi:alkylation response protein AidB-like acyl-CoA dehydrogenase